MTDRTVISFNLDGLETLTQQLGKTYFARVGILGDKAERKEGDSDLNNAQIGLIQIFGSLSKKIPPRDFLITPLVLNNKRLLEALASSGKMKAAIAQQDFKKCFKLLGIIAETFIHEAFATSGNGLWPPNKPSTIARKKSDKPLIDSRQLERSISSDVQKQ